MANVVRYDELPHLIPCYRRNGPGDSFRAIRWASGTWQPASELHYVDLVPPTADWRKAKIYLVQISQELTLRWRFQKEHYYVAAFNNATMDAYLSKRYGNIAKKSAGMAKSALGKLMHKISAKERDTANPTPRAERIASKRTFAIETVNGNTYTLTCRDDLFFAQLAVNGGRGGVNLALKKAANKIAGLIQHKCKDFLLPGEVKTPFPEIRRRIA